MICDVQAILTDAACFNTLNAFQLQVVQAALWCQIAEALAGP